MMPTGGTLKGGHLACAHTHTNKIDMVHVTRLQISEPSGLFNEIKLCPVRLSPPPPAQLSRYVMQLGEAEAGNVVRYGRGLAQKSAQSGSGYELKLCLCQHSTFF